MILDSYNKKRKLSDEEKQVEKWYIQYCLTNGVYDHMTDEELDERYQELYKL